MKVAELMKKYKAAVAACSVDQITIQVSTLINSQMNRSISPSRTSR